MLNLVETFLRNLRRWLSRSEWLIRLLRLTKVLNRSPRRTWFGHFPIARIDHIFVSSRMEVTRVDVGADYLARIASDHRPLFAELRVKQ